MRVPDPDKAGSGKAGSGTSIRDLIFDLRPDLRHVFGSAADFYLHIFFRMAGIWILSLIYLIFTLSAGRKDPPLRCRESFLHNCLLVPHRWRCLGTGSQRISRDGGRALQQGPAMHRTCMRQWIIFNSLRSQPENYIRTPWCLKW